MESVEVIVGQRDPRENVFKGFKARFKGQKIATFQAGDRRRLTLYRCGWNRLEGYRVYDSDETNPESSKYELMPHEEAVNPEDPYRVYHRLYSPSEVAALWPVFAKEVNALQPKDVDAKAVDPAWNDQARL